MKKHGFITKLLLLASALALGGCDFSNFISFDEKTKVTSLEISDYSTEVYQDTEYKFDGKAIASFSDNTVLDVTRSCTFTDLDTEFLGKKPFTVTYEYDGTKTRAKTEIEVIECFELTKIEAINYSKIAPKGQPYSFDGKVIATYKNGRTKDVTSKATIGSINTGSVGNKTLSIKYTEGETTKTISVTITVNAMLDSISASDYSSYYYVGSIFAFDGKVTARYSDGSKRQIAKDSYKITGTVNTSVIGDYELTISYSELEIERTCKITISVGEVRVTSITASGYTNYCYKGETYAFDGEIEAHYEDGTSRDVTSLCAYSTLDTSAGGIKTFSISYTESSITVTCKINITVKVHLESITLESSYTLGVGKKTTIVPTFVPSNATNKNVTYSTVHPSIATVTSAGLLTGISAGTTTLTVTSDENNSVFATATVVVSEQALDAWTILLYMCGADLESDSGLATSDLNEIKSVYGQPDDVNIVIETGGSRSWSSTQGGAIDPSKLSRFHLQNRSYVTDSKLTYANMGSSSTLQSFLEWGIDAYPAQKYGLIFWNHGGALSGVCFDEKSGGDGLTSGEVETAVRNAFNNTGVDKFEFVGYDACLMQMMEVADFNAPYFNYQITSQEAESGYGWDYDTWVDDLFAKKPTTTILKAIVDGFIASMGGVNSSGGYYPDDQTLSYLDLSKMSAFKNAWETLATQTKTKITDSNKSSFKSNILAKVKYFAGSDYYGFGAFDCYHYLTLLGSNSTFNPGGSYVNNAKNAFNDLVKYSVVQTHGAGDAHGLSYFYTVHSYYDYSSTTYDKFTSWVSLMRHVGTFSSTYGS